MTTKNKKRKLITVATVTTPGGVFLCLPFELENFPFSTTPGTPPLIIHHVSLYDLEDTFETMYFLDEFTHLDGISDGFQGLFINGYDENGEYKPIYHEAGHHPEKGDYWTEIDPQAPGSEYLIKFQDGTTVWINNDDDLSLSLDTMIKSKLNKPQDLEEKINDHLTALSEALSFLTDNWDEEIRPGIEAGEVLEGDFPFTDSLDQVAHDVSLWVSQIRLRMIKDLGINYDLKKMISDDPQ